jgi:D-glycero-D-manno-heptose 1,7-bisphosphate phosphatase
MTNGRPQKAVFIDRDGTLIEEVNFLSRVEDLRVFDFTNEAVGLLKAAGYLIFVVTNQSGIGRNIYDEEAMNSIHEAMQEQIAGGFDGFYFCPHLPCDGCECRKPNLGMINAARADFAVDMENSWMIGDKDLDVETGVNAKVRTAMVMTGYGKKHIGVLNEQPDVLAENLLDAVKQILERG